MSESNDRRIDDATPDTDVTGSEKVPVSDGGTAKCITVEQIKDFVATKFAALQNASGVSVNSDGVYLKKDGELKPVAANVFADSIIAFMFGKESETELEDTDEIVISRGGEVKKTTIVDFAEIVKEAIGTEMFNIDALEEASATEEFSGSIAAAVDYQGERRTMKFSFEELIPAIVYRIVNGNIFNRTSLDENDDAILVSHFDRNTGIWSLNRIYKFQLPFGDGNVKGPSANTANKIPQWDGANSKKLKDGLNLATNINSQSGDTEIPTALAVHNVTKDKAFAPQTNTSNRIPQWDGSNSKTLKDGLDFATAMGSTPSNNKVLSEKAVSDAISSAFTSALESGGSIQTAISDAIIAALQTSGAIGSVLSGKAGAPSSSTQDYIPQWDSTSKTLKNGKQLVTSISQSSSDNQIPTAKAVFDATQGSDTSNLVKAPYSTTQGQVPKWSSTSKTFDYGGYSVCDTYPTYPSSDELMTSNAVLKTIPRSMNVLSSKPINGQTGYETGRMWYCTDSSSPGMGLYINVGDSSSSSWRYLPDSIMGSSSHTTVSSSEPTSGVTGYPRGFFWFNTGTVRPGLYINIGDYSSSYWEFIAVNGQ